MPIEPVIQTSRSVRPAVEADRQRSDGRSKRERDRSPSGHSGEDEAHPAPNDRGQITGKIIDVTA